MSDTEDRRFDAEDEVLVDVNTAATGSVFSPNMWVQRPHKAARTPGGERPMRRPHDAHMYGASQGQPQMSPQQPFRHTPDKELAYLEGDDQEGTRREQVAQDLAHLAQLEEELVRADEQQRVLQARLQVAEAVAAGAGAQSECIKRLLLAMRVQREDLLVDVAAMGPDQKQQHMLGLGRRLVVNMHSKHPSAGGPGDMPAGAGIPAYLGPPSTAPRQHPAEAQIAAAALVLAGGDPAQALRALLARALAVQVHNTQAAAASFATGTQ